MRYLHLPFSIRVKLIGIVFVFGIPILLTGILWYNRSTAAIERNAEEFSLRFVQQVNFQLDTYFKNLEQFTYPLLTHPLIQEFGRLQPDNSFERIQVTKQMQDSLFPNFMFGRPDIENAVVITTKGIAVSNTGGISTLDRFHGYMSEPVQKAAYSITGLQSVEPVAVISVLRPFMDTTTFQLSGMVILDVNMDELLKIAGNMTLTQSGYVWIMDAARNYVYHPDRSLWGQPVPSDMLADLLISDSGSFVKREATGEKEMLIYQRSGVSGWTMVSVIPIREIMQPLIGFHRVSVAAGTVLFILALFVVVGLALYLTRSLLHLSRLMKRAENGDLSVRAPEKTHDELGSLNRSFNKMVGRIQLLVGQIHSAELKEKELLIREKDSQLLAMQYQINPHFLYNTLEAINAHAILDDNKQISKMTVALADMFRYNVGDPRKLVTLADEIEHIRKYLAIQQERYASLQVHIDVDRYLAERTKIVRFSLQPILENAFIHGYERSKRTPTYIAIEADAIGESLRVSVIDHGNGMPEATRRELNEKFALDASVYNADGSSARGIGLWNVHYRIRQHLGENYGLYVSHSNEHGTAIQLLLPLNQKTLKEDAD